MTGRLPGSGSAARAGIAVVAVTRAGVRLGGEIAAMLGGGATLHVTERWSADAPPAAVALRGPLSDHVARLFPEVAALVFVLATGATVRLVAPLLGRKQDDPAVVAIDEAGQHVIALLGGHQADANGLAVQIADLIGATPVISTASDVTGLPALDIIGRRDGWRIEATPDALKRASAAVVAGEATAIVQEAGPPEPIRDLPASWPRLDSLAALRGWTGPRMAITDRLIDPEIVAEGGPLIAYRPPTLILGVGCSLGAPADEIEQLARAALANAGLAWASVAAVASIDRRQTEPGVVEMAHRAAVPLVTYTAEQLAAVTDAPSPSAAVQRHVGTPGVCEPAAILASDGGALIVAKQKSAHATVAIARRAPSVPGPSKLWLVGMGPGPLDLMTPRARRAIREADFVIGYRAYLKLVAELVAANRLLPYELGQERDRAAEAIRLAREGRTVALVSSGDIGVYGMAGLVFELLHDAQPEAAVPGVVVEMIPGVTAASSANALLGAPLMLDFVAISLSDLLVPWDGIRQRLVAAAEGDLVTVLYNPASARRRQPFIKALDILHGHRSSETPVGLVRDAYRPDQEVRVTTLGALTVDQVDMRTVVVIGCSRTEVLDGRIVTRRGYLSERA